MRKIKLLVMLFSALFLVVGCTQKNAVDPPVDNNTNQDADEEEKVEDQTADEEEEKENVEVSMINYFLPDGSTAHYEGDGNEFAELNIRVTHLDGKYVVIDEDNGGATMRKIYQVENDKIETLSEDVIDYDEPLPSQEAISNLTAKEIYLQKPFEVGTTFNEWTIVETDATVDTPYQNFEQVLVIEMKENDFTNRKYFAEGYGEIKREAVMITEDEEDFIVTSTLESVDK
ncbi:hypothetical protein JSQ81_01930 [Sporosarcina sp. Marseille-Q4063]|uniref:hypothetical protein n=1 Tax=Sporosarcina sp. Marseille-Q4063 TaxID=2810514 RepID=UPI001BB0C56F|nr:hypothetical protein [Sporosarcina sp. Marseille-Q4063]QUW22370.1 hypothetical protein JSQ81_01930 [Sporosarcina sp. Marseille-Q4063]